MLYPLSYVGAGAKCSGGETPRRGGAGDIVLVDKKGRRFQASVDDDRVRFIVTELRRSGPTVIVNAQLQLADPQSTGSAQVNDTFDDGSRRR